MGPAKIEDQDHSRSIESRGQDQWSVGSKWIDWDSLYFFIRNIYICIRGGLQIVDWQTTYMNHGNDFASYPYQDVGPSEFMVSKEKTLLVLVLGTRAAYTAVDKDWRDD